MDPELKRIFFEKMERHPFAVRFGITLVALDSGYSKVEMRCLESDTNIFGSVHGGAVFALVDTAFETACNSHGTVAVALSISVNYHAAAKPGALLIAEATEVALTKRTGTYDIKVRDEAGRLIASCLALAFRKGSPLPFMPGG